MTQDLKQAEHKKIPRRQIQVHMFGHLRSLAHLAVNISLVYQNKPSGLGLIALPLFIHGVKVSQICQLQRTSPSERTTCLMGAVKKNLLLIFYIISIAQVTSRGGIVSPGRSLNS